MVTNHLRAPYSVYFTKNRTILRHPAGGRKNRTIFYHFFRHRTVPGEVKVLLKISRRRTAFGSVIEGKMTSARHLTVSRRRTAGVCTHLTGSGRCCMSLTATGEKRREVAEVHFAST